MTAIIILNWNGAADTIECLQSLKHVQEDYFCVVADNGSQEDSIRQIEQYLHTSGCTHRIMNRGEQLDKQPTKHEIILYKMGENLGFAKGNNEALRLLSSFAPDHYLLLNNDTIVEPSFLQSLQNFSKEHPDIQALTPLICYHYDHNIVWNAGGKLFFGLRKYYYAKQPVQAIKETGHIMVTFLTGCALFFSPQLLREDGGIFTEDFFFGEEDFNFCLRMNQQKQKMACVLTSKIYHKVSASVTNRDSLGKTYIYYLNRFVDMRLHYHNNLYYHIWAWLYPLYICLLLHKLGYSLKTSFKFIAKVICQSRKQTSVSQQDFISAITGFHLS